MTDIHIRRDYPHSPAKVWRAVTDPSLVPRWTATGRGGRPEGFSTAVGTRFRFVGKPLPGWNGIVECEVLEAQEPRLLRYSWRGDAKGRVTEVTYRIEPHGDGPVSPMTTPDSPGSVGSSWPGSCWPRCAERCSTSDCPRS